MLRLFFILVCLLVLPFFSEAAEQTLLISIPRAVTVEGTAFSLGDVAEFEGPEDVAEQMKALLLSVENGVLTRDQVVEVLKVSGLEGVRVKLKMPGTVTVERGVPSEGEKAVAAPSRPIEPAGASSSDAKRLAQALKDLALWNGDVEVDFQGSLPEGDLVSPSSLVPGTPSATLKFRDSKGRERSFAVRMTWTQPVLILTRSVSKGKTFAGSDFVVRSLRINKPGEYASTPAEAVGRSARRNLKQGDPVPLDSIIDLPIIEKGSKITLIVRNGQIVVRASGEAMESGLLGSEIKVKNLSSKTILKGVVVGKDTVEVKMP